MEISKKHVQMIDKLLSIILIPLLTILLTSCGASTSDRYGSEENKKESVEKKKTESKKEFKENFDLTPYHASINIKERKKESKPSKDLDIWYNYENKSGSDTSMPQVINQVEGYRVQVYSTDNLEEADSIRTRIYSQINRKDVYISFEPPFYKVKVGDFTKISEAKDLSFKLNQIGYTEAKVINDKINVFKEN